MLHSEHWPIKASTLHESLNIFFLNSGLMDCYTTSTGK